MKTLTINKRDKTLKGRIILPASKSISNRLLVIRAMSGKDFPISGLSESDDTLLLQKILSELAPENNRKKIVEINTGNAGTVMRFMTAFLALQPGKWILTGSDRMKQRPIGILVDALRNLGADIEYLARIGYPPLLIKGYPLQGGETVIECGVSSQFCSALLMIAPYLPDGLVINLKGQPVSGPYIDMTLQLMEHYGSRFRRTGQQIIVKPGTYSACDLKVEADWSSASFWYEAAAMADKVDLELIGLRKESTQGDSILTAIYRDFGIMTEYLKDGIRLTRTQKKTDGYYFNFSDYPDIAPPVITTCAVLGIRGRFEGLQSLKIKETNRLLALRNELEKLGIIVFVQSTHGTMPVLEFDPTPLKVKNDLIIETYGDHRMAMTFAPVALKTGSIKIADPGVVRKSYPQFWEHLEETGFEIR